MKLVTVITLWATASHCFDVENGVVDRPSVNCGIDKIVVDINTEKPFRGRLYVQGESDNEHCVMVAPNQSSSHAQFDLPIGACNMRRQRTMHPRGVSFSFTLVVSFHPFFVVGFDRAFHIRCFFLESVKSLNVGFDVSNLKTELVEQELKLPECHYQLRDGVNGPPVQYAQVGQRVTHRWRCEDGPSYVYGFLIHSCLVDDGQGNQFELIDDKGCSKDSYLLPQIEYDPQSLSAFTDAHVFKYADKVQIYFTCTVQLCYKHDGGCEGVTPPICEDSKHPSDVIASLQHIEQSQVPYTKLQKERSHEARLPTEKHRGFEEGGDSQYEAPFVGPLLQAKEFFGPIDVFSNFERYSYRDSPLNLTETDDVSLLSWNMTAAGNGEEKKTKKRRDLNMETDLSVDVIVLPFEKTNLGQPRPFYVCMSRTAALLVLLAALITTALCTTIAFVAARRTSFYRKTMDAFH